MDVKVPIFRDREAGDYSCGLDFFSCYAQGSRSNFACSKAGSPPNCAAPWRECCVLCFKTGDTPEEAIQNLLGTVHYTLDLYEKEGLTLPADYQPEDPEGPDVVSVVTLPIDVPQG
jgi:predicted RNase H-like HicB family nuclease